MFRLEPIMLDFDRGGLSLGETRLAKANAMGAIDFAANEARILAILSIAYKAKIPQSIFVTLRKAVSDWNGGLQSRACIRLAHLNLPEIESDSPAWQQIRKAEQEFDDGLVSDAEIFAVLKRYNPDEPRDAQGRWTTSDAADDEDDGDDDGDDVGQDLAELIEDFLPDLNFNLDANSEDGGNATDSPPQQSAHEDEEVGQERLPGVVDASYANDYVTAPDVKTVEQAEAIKRQMDGDFYGDTEDCANLTKRLAPDVPQHTSLWQRGDLVEGNTDIPIGTAIATFNYYGQPGTNGYGPSQSPGGVVGQSHTGIYLGQNESGLALLNQYYDSDGVIISHIPWNMWNYKTAEAGNRYYTVKSK